MNINTLTSKTRSISIRHIALPQDHGSWVFLLCPLLIGLFAGRGWSASNLVLSMGVISAFLLRQPITIAVKVFSGRRPKRELSAARFWILIYGLISLCCLLYMIHHGYDYLLYLLLPGIVVFMWHLYLVSRRAERRQLGVELIATGVLSLAAPAAYWVGIGYPDAGGWLLFLLIWLQSAASIVYAYLRLEQRVLKTAPNYSIRLCMAWRALAYTTFNFVVVITLSLRDFVPVLLPVPYMIQWLETIWGTARPAIGVRPALIGTRQLVVSSLFTLFFILAWRWQT
jgi:hypothetical protein